MTVDCIFFRTRKEIKRSEANKARTMQCILCLFKTYIISWLLNVQEHSSTLIKIWISLNPIKVDENAWEVIRVHQTLVRVAALVSSHPHYAELYSIRYDFELPWTLLLLLYKWDQFLRVGEWILTLLTVSLPAEENKRGKLNYYEIIYHITVVFFLQLKKQIAKARIE